MKPSVLRRLDLEDRPPAGPSWGFVIPFTAAVLLLFIIGAEVGGLIARHWFNLTCS